LSPKSASINDDLDVLAFDTGVDFCDSFIFGIGLSLPNEKKDLSPDDEDETLGEENEFNREDKGIDDEKVELVELGKTLGSVNSLLGLLTGIAF
jgi:hypothetical protein